MKIAAHVIAYDVNRYINSMLRNVAPWVDKIYLAYPPRPWNYVPSAREARRNPTKLSDINTTGLPCPVEIIEGDWVMDEDTRNACLDRARSEGFDWLIIQDADEFYVESDWRQLKRALLLGTSVDCYRTTWYNFWKSSEFVIMFKNGSIKSTNVGFALRCKPGLRFSNSRTSNAAEIRTIDCPCYHYGMVKSDEEMLQKVTQWTHAPEFNGPRWFRTKWLMWRPETRNICNSRNPRGMKCALRFPLHQPDFAAEFALPVVQRPLTIRDQMADAIFNGHAFAYDMLIDAKRAVVG